MRFGFHCSIAGGLIKALERACSLGCETLQIFTRNPRGWRFSPLAPEQVDAFKARIREREIHPLVVHMPYLPNLASPDEDLYQRSVASLKAEVERCRILGAQYLVTHVGKAMGDDPGKALERVAKALLEALGKGGPVILLENTAGQGSELGANLEELGKIIALAGKHPGLGLCVDTAHAFQAGYPIHTRDGLDGFLEELDRFVGLERLRLLHLNDSRTPLGSRVDRHWHIGEGEIGLEGFKNIIGHPLLWPLPAIMETPFSPQWDVKNMERVRALAGSFSHI